MSDREQEPLSLRRMWVGQALASDPFVRLKRGGSRVRKSLRYVTVLFFLSLVAMAATLGTDVAFPLGVGGPLEDVRVWSGIEEDDADLARLLDGYSIFNKERGSGAAPAVAGVEQRDLAAVPATSGRVEADGSEVASPKAEAEEDGAEKAEAAAVLSEPEPVAEPEPEPEPRPLILTHVIQAGETLWDISRLYDIDVDTILAANETVDPNRLRIGTPLTILTVRGALHTVRSGESLWDISRTYGVSIDEIAANNGISDPSRLQVSTRLVIPGAQAQAAALRRDAVLSSDGRLIRNFEWPLRARISSRYGMRWGRMHHGLDIAVPVGTPVRAAAGGVVSFSGVQGGYGNIVIIDHGNGVETRYAHLSRNVVSKGQRVARGELIAYSGNTGQSTGPHLHFEIRQRGQSVNPELYLK